MRASLTYREYAGWQQYYKQEPWGPWRDNVHAALIAREIRASRPSKGGQKLDLEQFILTDKEGRREKSTAAAFGFLRMIAKRKVGND
jgi:hypothetical protein